MNSLKKLEERRLIREFDYIKSDYDFKSECHVHQEREFLTEVGLFLENHPDLKAAYGRRIDSLLVPPTPESVCSQESESPTVENFPDVSVSGKSKIKSMYRSIVKSTHPDRVSDSHLNEIYVDATKAYDSESLVRLMSICDKMNIPYEISESEIEIIRQEINNIRRRADFFENTFSWKWAQQRDETVRQLLVLSYIKNQLI